MILFYFYQKTLNKKVFNFLYIIVKQKENNYLFRNRKLGNNYLVFQNIENN